MTIIVERDVEYDESEKKSLFILDIDNVLNTDEHIKQVNEEAGIQSGSEFEDFFAENAEKYLDPKLVNRLDECLKDLDPNPFIVTCSSWQDYGCEFITEALKENGFSHTIHQQTHEYYLKISSNRTEEVQSTISQIDPNRLVILDDLAAYGTMDCDPDFCFTPHHVQPEDGLTHEHIDKIKELWRVDFEYEPLKPPSMREDDDG